jgi:3-phosphoshikimate 1-carboxyvinyltransferase
VTVTIQPSIITGTITAPASKSSMQRACALALLAGGETQLFNPGKSNDDKAALEIIKELGAIVLNNADGSITVKAPVNNFTGSSINCGESGLSIRMFAAIAALQDREITINGSGSLVTRPMHLFDEVFPQLGVTVTSNNGFLPLKVKGPLLPEDISIDGSLSSQFLTGLLIAFAKAATKPVTITVQNLKSKPYIDLTLQMMREFGYEIQNINYEQFILNPSSSFAREQDSKHAVLPRAYTVECDWSGAAFLLVAGAIAGSVTLKGLDVFSKQADRAILQPLMNCGAVTSIEETQVTVGSPLVGRCQAFHFNATDCPDLFPPLVALAACCEGTSVIEGASRLAHKESNRALTLQEEFAKMGIDIRLQDDLMMIAGTGSIKGAHVHSHHDHRIAMACAVAALKAEGDTVIDHAEAVNKSYPGFYEDLKMLKAAVSLVHGS